ncbi:MAG: hypothetical protein ACI8S6_003076 [Myxococcota bacterium]|jgi:hypothetical protein
MRHFLFLLALVACDEVTVTDEPNDAWPYCEDVEFTITVADETALGITGGDLIDAASLSAEGSASWSGGGSSGLLMGFSLDEASLRFVESTEVYPEPEPGQDVPSIAVECPDYVAVDGILSLHTEDGQLDEAITITLAIDEHSVADLRAGFFAELDAEALGGTLVVEDYLSDRDYDAVRLFLSGELAGGSFSGALDAQGSGSTGDAVFAENIPIATFDSE